MNTRVITAVVVTFLSLAGCGGNNGNTETAEESVAPTSDTSTNDALPESETSDDDATDIGGDSESTGATDETDENNGDDTDIAEESQPEDEGEAETDPLDSSNVSDNFQSYPFQNLNPLARVQKDWTPALTSTWQGLKSRNIDSYGTGMVHRPRSEQPGDAVSEGIGYGMILALYSNDQTYFNKIWDAGERTLWNGRFYDWRSDEFGNVIGTGAATDAEQDIAMMLIFADHLVQRGVWSGGHISPQGAGYAERAQDLLDVIWSDMVDDGRYLRPGSFWGGRNMLNPGYFSPAWYRLYKQFDTNGEHDWDALIDQSYHTIEAGTGYGRGLIADWSDAWGNTLAQGPGYNAYDNGQSMFKDGIRILWRVATDALWFNEARAQRFLNNAIDFLRESASNNNTSNTANSPAHLANFYQLNGEQVPLDDIWTDLNGGNTQRSRNEHSHMTIGMWATAAIAAGQTDAAEAFSRELQTFYEGGSFWGKTFDPTGHDEDIEHNEMYFDQFLAWFGAITLNGNFCNILVCVR